MIGVDGVGVGGGFSASVAGGAVVGAPAVEDFFVTRC